MGHKLKLKPRKGLVRRIRMTGSGLVKRSHAGRGHLRRRKPMKRIRALRRPAYISRTDESKIKTLLPYC